VLHIIVSTLGQPGVHFAETVEPIEPACSPLAAS
jgi:hypothetical protein